MIILIIYYAERQPVTPPGISASLLNWVCFIFSYNPQLTLNPYRYETDNLTETKRAMDHKDDVEGAKGTLDNVPQMYLMMQ